MINGCKNELVMSSPNPSEDTLTTSKTNNDVQSSPVDKDGNITPTSCDNTKPTIAEMKSLTECVTSLKKRIEQIENQITIPGISSITVGEGILTNRRSLARTMHLLSTKADAQKLKLLYDECERQMSERDERIRHDLADSKSVDNLSQCIAALTKRTDLLSQDLNNKIDNSLFKTVESDAETIRNHASFVQTTNDAITTLRAQLETLTETARERENTLTGLSEHVTLLQRQLQQKATPLANFFELQSQFRDVASTVSTRMAEKSDLETTAAHVADAANRLAATERDVKNHERRLANLATRLEKMYYTRRETDARWNETTVQKCQFHAVLRELREDIGKKAWEHSVRALREDIDGTRRVLAEWGEDYEVTKRRALLAAQFVEWYGRKGEDYEHNLNAVDGCLRGLARRDDERRRF
mmetsp:Transcript_51961/g.62489  ORF Transcript_51961/g.62489 Transcript_51961/m.62489 type:complete len:414 (-) Transcript_51961:166-1407(-)|eukprot:CAMPEP_0172513586 /NCGR_PEP_ID=MMETSP1066-20121228/253720_1 /TAXON_ID=671091 /ORGANISM="Coscinodiscus wailesii, Strain CCMP2513" /LENGTH=413 /DNA_ID=CAMNT_0013293919 /DNA_START=101 /DNA_END=1342 /DNA_ORIENTATION=-